MYLLDANLSPAASGLLKNQLVISRKSFLKICSILALSYAGCGSFLDKTLSKTQYSSLLINEPHPDDYQPILNALIKTILPFDHPQFPNLSPAGVLNQLHDLFPFRNDPAYLPLRRSLILFNETNLFAEPFPHIIEEEKRRTSNWSDEIATNRLNHENNLFDRYQQVGGSAGEPFLNLPASKKQAYFKMWGKSAYRIKRQFYQGVKTVIMITAYSTPELWKTIQYAGPVLAQNNERGDQ